MVATGCAIQAGDVLYKRFQRTQLKQQLGKLTPLIAVFLSVCLLTSQLAFAQTPTQIQPKRNNYQTLFTLVSGLTVQTKKVCKTEACAKAADELAVVIADGKDKHSRGLLVDETRKQFHGDFRTSMKKLRAALADNLSDEDKAAMARRPECPSCDKAPQVRPIQNGTQEECSLCWDVLEISSGICTLYATCPTCVLICLSAAALSFGNCIERWCKPDPGGYYNPN
jgi:hypothetical protein